MGWDSVGGDQDSEGEEQTGSPGQESSTVEQQSSFGRWEAL
jgi:hypothetical protein